MSTSTAVVPGLGKQGTKSTIPQGVFFLPKASNHRTHNYIFITGMMQSIITHGETQTFIDRYSISFNNLYLNATLSLTYSYMPVMYCATLTMATLQFALSLILKVTATDTTLHL